ncbi:MAG: hypothetical protein KDK41_17710 [Leptospiraceae bacterium]|nr:hypothetical protein [Leptospiraceae bacterium]
MPCVKHGNAILCYNRAYRYKGYFFEVGFPGPHELRKDGDPKERFSKGFWDAATEFMNLPKEEQKQYEVNS